MAEYIDRDLIEWYGCDFEDGGCENRECSGCSHAECSHSQVMQIPTANVIPIPKGATNGDMIKAMFPDIALYEKNHDAIEINFNGTWWNAPYRLEGRK